MQRDELRLHAVSDPAYWNTSQSGVVGIVGEWKPAHGGTYLFTGIDAVSKHNEIPWIHAANELFKRARTGDQVFIWGRQPLVKKAFTHDAPYGAWRDLWVDLRCRLERLYGSMDNVNYIHTNGGGRLFNAAKSMDRSDPPSRIEIDWPDGLKNEIKQEKNSVIDDLFG